MDWKLGPPVLVGEKVFWAGNFQDHPQSATVRWIGKIPELSSGWCVGIEFDSPIIHGGSNGFWKDRKLFECQPKNGMIVTIEEIQRVKSRYSFRRTTIQSHLDLKLDDSQLRDFKHLDLENKSYEKIQQIVSKNHYSSGVGEKSKSNEWSVKNRKSAGRSASGLDSTIRKKFNRTSKFEDTLGSLKTKKQDDKSLRKVKRKRNPYHEIEFKRPLSRKLDSNHYYVQDATDDFINFTVNKAFENPQNSSAKNMNEVVGYFKEIKEDGKVGNEEDKPLNSFLPDSNVPGQSKEKKFFSFLKWFKKNKDDPVLKNFTESSAASSPMFVRKRTTSCESIDTLFSTQTVRSFAYIPPTQYLPSAPPSSLLDFSRPEEDAFENNVSQSKDSFDKEEVESIYDKKKKRKAPDPPRLSRENSLPSTLEHKKSEEDLMDGTKTQHRRTVSESFKDKKAGAYCHVQGKRKAPLPPLNQSIYPNLQKLNTQYSSLNKKKKPAPPPPESKNGEIQNFNNPNERNVTNKDGVKEKLGTKNEKFGEDIVKERETNEIKPEKGEKKKGNSNQILTENPTKDVSLSPLPSRPWYKRSHRDSSGSNIIRKDLLKGFEKKKNKESEDWMPEVGFPRRSFSSDSSHNKFNIFSRLDKNEDRKKEEKRKSQISILTNISELDREAAEIVRKEQAEEKKIKAANDAKYYSSNSSSEIPNFKDNNDAAKGLPSLRNPVNSGNKRENEKLESPKPVPKSKANENKTFQEQNHTKHFRSPFEQKNDEERRGNGLNKNEQLAQKDEKSNDVKENVITKKENISQVPDRTKEIQSNGKTKENVLSPNILADVTNSSKSPASGNVKPNGTFTGSNYFKVENKELNYLNKPWTCQKCTLENPGWRVFCEICSSVKPRFLVNVEKKPGAQMEKPMETSSKTGEKKTEETQLVAEKAKVDEPNLASEKNLPPNTNEDKNDTDGSQMKESLEEIRKKRMTFFNSKSDGSQESKSSKELTSIGSESGKKEIRESLPTKESESSSREKSRETEEKPKADNIAFKSENLRQEETEPLKPVHLPKNSQIKPVTGDGEKYGAVKKQQPPRQKKEEIAEAYVVTKTIVLEDIIIKKGEKTSKVSTSSQTNASRAGELTSDSGIRPPPRTKKNVVDASVETKSTHLGPKPCSSKKKHDVPLDLTIVEGESQKEDKNFEELEELTNKLTHAEGVADFRANIETMAPNTEMNTVAVNRLLRRLEAAINNGEHFVAAGLAKELALMKINCSVTRQVENPPPPPPPVPGSSKITIDLYVEDKVSHQGPIQIQVSPMMTLLQLKKKVNQELGIPMDVQRWILGKQLATDENKTLDSAGIVNDSCSVFLYLVAPGNRDLERKNTFVNADRGLETKLTQIPVETKQKASAEVKGKGWYYNYEEDHYSFCEDTEDESLDSSSNPNLDCKEENGSQSDLKTASTSKIFQNDKTNPTLYSEPREETKKLDKTSLFSLQTREAESDVEKEVKLIPVNSVKQKVEKLNKSFAESKAPQKINLKTSQSMLEYWKCVSCAVANAPGRQNCFKCNAKKGDTKFEGEKKTPPENQSVRRNNLKSSTNKSETTDEENIHYKALLELQDADLVPNIEGFNCPICLVDYTPGEGVTLKDCLHTFCRACLINTVQFSEDAEVKCPYFDDTYSCMSVLQQREIKALVPKKLFELHLAKSVKEAENKIGNAFHCKTPDCKGWCIYEDNVNEFHCPVCKNINCLTCQAIHGGVNCKQYQERMKDASETDEDAKKTRQMLEEMVQKGEAMACPKCQVVLMKKWGCDWLRCSMCKTEICWVTRGFRWGPEGKGDTSGGCKCGVNGIKCHPKCNYCH